MKLFGLAGIGGFAREVMPWIRDTISLQHPAGDFECVFLVEPGVSGLVNGHCTMTEREFLARDEERHFNVAIADHRVREKIASRLTAGGAVPFSAAAYNSVCMANNQIGEGALLSPFTTITSNVTIGRFFHGNIYSYVAHDCQIGDFVTFAPNVHCNGRVIVEDYAYIGAGAIIKHGSDTKPLVIGRGAVVGMGAVVTKNVEPYSTVVGSPAVPLTKSLRHS